MSQAVANTSVTVYTEELSRGAAGGTVQDSVVTETGATAAHKRLTRQQVSLRTGGGVCFCSGTRGRTVAVVSWYMGTG